MTTAPEFLNPTDSFVRRHIGPSDADVREMLALLALQSLQALSDAIVPGDIQLSRALDLPVHCGEQIALQELRRLADENRIYRSFLGMGYYDCITPGVIQRNILENPGWYTQYTPYHTHIPHVPFEPLLTIPPL